MHATASSARRRSGSIEGSDTFVFVITPELVASSYCEAEDAHAVALTKCILPVLRTSVADDQIPPDIRFPNWIPFTDETTYDGSVQRLSTALDRDLVRDAVNAASCALDLQAAMTWR